MEVINNTGAIMDDNEQTVASMSAPKAPNEEVQSQQSVNQQDGSTITQKVDGGGTLESQKPIGEDTQSTQQKAQKATPLSKENFYRELMKSHAYLYLSEEGDNYLKALTKSLNEDGFKVVRNPSTGAFIIHSEQEQKVGKHWFCICLFFAECVQTVSNSYSKWAPKTDVFASTEKDLQKQINDLGLKKLQSVLVTPDDYPKVRVMAKQISNTLTYMFSREATIANFEAGSLSIVGYRADNAQKAAEYYELSCPHGISPYYQYLLAVNLNTKNYHNPVDYRAEWMNLFVVGMYTEFMFLPTEYNNHRPFIQPIITISSVATQYPVISLLPLVLSAVMKYVYNGDFYLSPMKGALLSSTQLQENPDLYAKTKPIYDINRYLDVVTCGTSPVRVTKENFEQFRREALKQPFIAFDYTPGRMGYTPITLLTNPNAIDLFQEFMVRNNKENAGQPEVQKDKELGDKLVWTSSEYYTGTTMIHGSLKDSRYWDFFTTTYELIQNNQPGYFQKATEFTWYGSRPDFKFEILNSLGFGLRDKGIGLEIPPDNLKSLYATTKEYLNPLMMSSITSMCNTIDGNESDFPESIPYSRQMSASEIQQLSNMYNNYNSAGLLSGNRGNQNPFTGSNNGSSLGSISF